MSSNNSSNVTFTKNSGGDEHRRLITIVLASDFIAFFLAVFINSWILVCILTSPTLRTRLRNQVICSLCALFVLENLFSTTIVLHYWLSYLNRWKLLHSCALFDYITNMSVICSAIPDLLLVILACVFLAQVLDFDPASKLRPPSLKVGHIAVLVSPWVFAGVVSPLALVGIAHKGFPCAYIDNRRYYIVESVFTIFPLCLAALIICVAWSFRCARFGRGSLTAQGNMAVQLMGSGPEVDNSLAYVGAVVVSLAAQMSISVVYFLSKDGTRPGLTYVVVSYCIEGYRAGFLPLTFLFLTDVRQRVKAWRPWRADNTPSAIDLTFKYNNQQ